MADGPSIVYVNGSCIAGSNATGSIVSYVDSRNGAILPRASDYNMAVQRFTAQGMMLPLYTPTIVLGQSNPNLTNLQFSIAWQYDAGGGDISPVFANTQSVMWTPQDATTTIPGPPQTQQVSSDYYNAYTYDHVLTQINNAIDAAVAACMAPFQSWWAVKFSNMDWPNIGAELMFSRPPSGFPGFVLQGMDPTIFTTPRTSIQRGLVTAQVTVSESLYMLFRGMPSAKVSNGYWIYPSPGLSLAAQQSDSGDWWSPVGSLLFSSSTLPIVSEVQGDPVKLGNSDFTPSASQNTIRAITDYVLPLEGGASDFLGLVTYDPAILRYISMTSSEPLVSLSWQLLWRNARTDELLPVRLTAGGSVSIKLVFVRRF